MTLKIKWAPKVGQGPIARLYERDAAGIRNNELLDREALIEIMTRHNQTVLGPPLPPKG